MYLIVLNVFTGTILLLVHVHCLFLMVRILDITNIKAKQILMKNKEMQFASEKDVGHIFYKGKEIDCSVVTCHLNNNLLTKDITERTSMMLVLLLFLFFIFGHGTSTVIP